MMFKKMRFFCGGIVVILIAIGIKYTFAHEVNDKSEVVTFVANSETMGDGLTPSTMDYFQGVQYPHLSLVIPSFKKTHEKVEVLNWLDNNIDWTTKSTIVFGPVWGYTKNIEQFMTWLDLIEKNNVNAINSPKFLKWNVKKNYLLDLQNHDINIPNTLIVESDSLLSFDEAMLLFNKKYGDSSDVILKGVIDAGAFGYMHVHSDRLDQAKEHFDKLKRNNYGVIIQNFIPQIYQKGELAFVFIDGKISYFFLKVPKINEERVQPFYGGRSFHFKKSGIVERIQDIKSNFRSDLELTEAEVEESYIQAELIYSKFLKTLDELNIPHPKYLRMDGVVMHSNFVVMELEGIEPYLEMQEAMNNDPTNKLLDAYVNSLVDNLKLSK